jgi:serine protease Do
LAVRKDSREGRLEKPSNTPPPSSPETSSSGARLSPRYVASLALAAITILVVGTLLRPRTPAAETAPPPSPMETQRLLRLAQRQALDTMTEHFAQVAAEVASRVVPIGGGVGTGLAWGQDQMIVPGHTGPAPETIEVTLPSGDRLIGTRYVWGPQLPLAVYTVPGLVPAPFQWPEVGSEPTSGEWVLAVWRQQLEHVFVPGHYLETQLTSCGERVVEEVFTSLALTAEQAGGGLFDLDDGLVGIILPCGERVAALTPSSASRLIAEGRTLDGQFLARLGMVVVAPDGDLGAHLDARGGLVVREVWTGYPAAAAGLRPGDVIESLSGQRVGSASDLRPLLVPSGEDGLVLGIRRGRRLTEVTLGTGDGAGLSVEGEEAGVVLEAPRGGYRIATVVPGSPGDEAGLRPGDLILRIDKRAPRSPAEVRRALDGKGPVYLELERGRRRLGLLLP